MFEQNLKMVFVHEGNGGISVFVHEFRAALLFSAVTRSVGLGIPKAAGRLVAQVKKCGLALTVSFDRGSILCICCLFFVY